MTNVVKIRKGLDIHLKGKASTGKHVEVLSSGMYALVPSSFVGLKPKVVVKEGDHVLAGEPLFVDKLSQEVRCASPVSGVVEQVLRGERRKVLYVKVKADQEQSYHDYGKHDVTTMTGDAVKSLLLESGLFAYINQLPYAVVASPSSSPKAIFVSALRDMPLAADFEAELQGNETAFQTGLTALSKMAPVFLGIGVAQSSPALTQAKDVTVTVFEGPCPAGNVGVQVNHISPVNRGEVVWTVDPSAVIFIGRLMLTGKVDLHRIIAVAGSQVKEPTYANVLVGTQIGDILKERLLTNQHVRILNGNPLTGVKCGMDDYLGAHTSEVTVIPEGDDRDEMLGWIAPRTSDFSVSRSYFSWLQGKHHEYDLDARVKGGERHMIMSGEYDKVLPMDIYGEYLIKALIAGDIDRQEQLGIYEVSPEDFALAEFVDSSKLPLQKIVRQGLDILRKENA